MIVRVLTALPRYHDCYSASQYVWLPTESETFEAMRHALRVRLGPVQSAQRSGRVWRARIGRRTDPHFMLVEWLVSPQPGHPRGVPRFDCEVIDEVRS
jgi:hypothetical protein